MIILFIGTEWLRLNFGFTGNINESYPDLMAFVIQTTLFSLPFAVVPCFSKFKYPHENALYTINLIFLILELLIGCYVMSYFSKTTQATFYRRTAPFIDKKFKKKYQNAEAFRPTDGERAIKLGMMSFNKQGDTKKVFADSDNDLAFNASIRKED